jgi:hypothetical protein
MEKLAAAAAVLMIVGGTAQSSAHHDSGATYNEAMMVTIEADLVTLSLRNPHSFMQVAVRTPGKPEVRYVVEWDRADDLRRAGIVGTTLKSGDRIVLTGQPSRAPLDHRLRLTVLRRPKDGLRWAEPMS